VQSSIFFAAASRLATGMERQDDGKSEQLLTALQQEIQQRLSFLREIIITKRIIP